MKKILACLVLLFMFSTFAFAAAATVSTTEYGYQVTGDTGAATVASGDYMVVKALVFSPVGASTDTAIITTGSSNLVLAKLTNTNGYVYFGDAGRGLQNIKVTLTAGTDVLAIVTQ